MQGGSAGIDTMASVWVDCLAVCLSGLPDATSQFTLAHACRIAVLPVTLLFTYKN